MNKGYSVVLLTTLIWGFQAHAGPRGREAPRAPRAAAAPRGHEAGPRSVGVHVVPYHGQAVHPTNNPPHQVAYHNERTGRDEYHAVVVEHRPAHVIDRDPHLRIARRGYHPVHDWEYFHPARGAWWRLWGIAAWDTVGTVTCEAANETNGELYPVSQDRDANGWDDGTVNAILDQALDDCAQEAGANVCVPATPSCTFQPY
jgi:hypothetical protein